MLIGKKLGPYKLKREVGRGEASTVYEAIDTRIGRTVAVKVQSVPSNMLPAERESLKRRMDREARAIGRLSHPNIAKIYVVGEQGSLNYLVMEYLDGISLQQRLDTGPLTPAESADILSQVAAGLEAVHAEGIVHRDIKPSNIMVLPDGSVKLTDFGLAHAADDPSLTSHGQVIGSPLYMSPEQANGQPATAASDVWALGVLLYHMLTGKSPFAAETVPAVLYKVVHEEPEIPSSFPEEIGNVLRQALDKNPERRFTSASALANAFRENLNDPTVVIHKQALPPLVPAVPRANLLANRAILSAKEAFTPRVPRPAEPHTAHRSRPVWQVATAVSAMIALIAFGGTSALLSQRGRNAPTTLEIPNQTSSSYSLPESVAPLPTPSPYVGIPVTPPGPLSSGAPRGTTASANKQRQVAVAKPEAGRVRILSSKVTPSKSATPPARTNSPIEARTTDNWKIGELLPPKPNQNVPAPTATPTPNPPSREITVNREAEPKPTPPVVAPRPPVELKVEDEESTPFVSNPASAETIAELRDLLAVWIEATKERKIEEQMEFYAPRLTRFYQARGVSQDAVRAEKQRVFGRANMVEMTVSEPEITFSPNGRTAKMHFRKKYYIRGGPGERRGEVQQELRWQLFDDGWKIISERDLRSQ